MSVPLLTVKEEDVSSFFRDLERARLEAQRICEFHGRVHRAAPQHHVQDIRGRRDLQRLTTS
ncbi:hypothetical protein [Candidatus Nitrospira bockiana]